MNLGEALEDRRSVRRYADRPAGRDAIVSIGWPDERPSPPPDRDMTEAVHWIEG